MREHTQTFQDIAPQHEAALGLAARGTEQSKGLGVALEHALVHHGRCAAGQGERDVIIARGALLQPRLGAVKQTDTPAEGEFGRLALRLITGELQEDAGSAAVGVEGAHADGSGRARACDDVSL
jgi:hypothetical protein